MAYHDKRAEGIALLRQHAREAAAKDVRAAYRDLRSATDALLQEFRREFDVPGTRYWEDTEKRHTFSTEPGERIDESLAYYCVELARHEFLSRQGIHFGYDEDAL